MTAARILFPLLGVTLMAAMPFVIASCGKKACFRWSDAEGVCPSRDEASKYFEGPPGCGTDILSIDSDADYDGELCCYDVTDGDTSETLCGTTGTGTVSTGSGPPPPSTGTGTMGCFGCADFVFAGGGAPLCQSSGILLDNLMTCICEGACVSVCLNTGCALPLNPDQPCFDCILNTDTGCGFQFNECQNDFSQF
jgi:hypothetical protein